MNDKNFSFFREMIFLGIVALFWFAQYVYIPYQAVYLSSQNVPDYFLGIIIGAYGISQLLLRFPVGVMADYFGNHKKFIMLGCLASSTASLFRVIWVNEKGFLIGNIFSGLASAMWISFMVYYMEQNKGNEHKATSRIVMFNNMGMLLAFIASMLVYSKINMKGICFLSFAGGLTAWLLSFFIYEKPVEKSSKNLKELFKVCREKDLIIFSLLALLQQGIQLTTVMSFTNKILRELNYSDFIVGMSSVVYMCSAVLFSAFAGTNLCRKRKPSFWITTVFIVVAFYNIFIPRTEDIKIIFVFQILAGMSTGILFSYLTSEAVKNIPFGKKSTAMGFFQAVYAVGMTVFPIITGNVAESFNMQTGYFMLAVFSVIGAVSAQIYYRKTAV